MFLHLLVMKNTVSLNKNYQFSRVYKRGSSAAGRYLILDCLKNRQKVLRLGITASKKVGNSVIRNRIRRLIKENYRQLEDRVVLGFDIVFIVRSNKKLPTYYDIKKEMKYLLSKLNMLRPEN